MTAFVVNILGQTAAGNTAPADSPKAAFGKVTLDATALTATEYLALTVGFTPKYVRFENATDRIMVEWFEGMAEDTCIKTAAAGTRTLETTNKGISIVDRPTSATGVTATTGRTVLISQNATLAVVAASKVCYWTARG